QEENGSVDAAFAQAADILETRFGNADDTAAQHGPGDLRHAASAFGYAEDADATGLAGRDHRARVTLDDAEVDGDRRSWHGHWYVRPSGSISGARPEIPSATNWPAPHAMVQPTWPWPTLR